MDLSRTRHPSGVGKEGPAVLLEGLPRRLWFSILCFRHYSIVWQDRERRFKDLNRLDANIPGSPTASPFDVVLVIFYIPLLVKKQVDPISLRHGKSKSNMAYSLDGESNRRHWLLLAR